MTDEITKRLERRNAELSRIQDSLERWHRRLTRAVTAIDKLRAEKKRLLKLEKTDPLTALRVKMAGADYHKIRETEFNGTIGF